MINRNIHKPNRPRFATGLLALMLCAGVGAVTGCEEGTFEDAGEDIDEAVEETQDAIEDAGDELEDATDDGGGMQQDTTDSGGGQEGA